MAGYLTYVILTEDIAKYDELFQNERKFITFEYWNTHFIHQLDFDELRVVCPLAVRAVWQKGVAHSVETGPLSLIQPLESGTSKRRINPEKLSWIQNGTEALFDMRVCAHFQFFLEPLDKTGAGVNFLPGALFPFLPAFG